MVSTPFNEPHLLCCLRDILIVSRYRYTLLNRTGTEPKATQNRTKTAVTTYVLNILPIQLRIEYYKPAL